MVIDSGTASGPGGRPAGGTASSITVAEHEDAGTGLSLVIDGVRHLQITTRPVPALNRPVQTLASRLCSDPGVLRGRPFSAAATASRSSRVCLLRSVPLGKYCRRSPLVFSFVPRCQGLCGSQK